MLALGMLKRRAKGECQAEKASNDRRSSLLDKGYVFENICPLRLKSNDAPTYSHQKPSSRNANDLLEYKLQ